MRLSLSCLLWTSDSHISLCLPQSKWKVVRSESYNGNYFQGLPRLSGWFCGPTLVSFLGCYWCLGIWWCNVARDLPGDFPGSSLTGADVYSLQLTVSLWLYCFLWGFLGPTGLVPFRLLLFCLLPFHLLPFCHFTQERFYLQNRRVRIYKGIW